jgi:hypothetical protein
MTPHANSHIDWPRVRSFVYFSVAGVAAGYFLQPFVHGNHEAREAIITLFSILAGFLIAVMTLVGDSSSAKSRSWRSLEFSRPTFVQRLERQKWLFYVYLLTLGLLFLSVLVPECWVKFTIWAERVYIGLAVASFLISLGLPGKLMSIQVERLDAAIEEKRTKPTDDENSESRS